MEETFEEERETLASRIRKLQTEAEDNTQLQVDNMTLQMKVDELEKRMQAGDGSSTTPKTDRKLNKVYGIFGKFYGNGGDH